MEAQDLAGHQKKAQKEGRTIVFIDESGLSQRPHRCRTWAPRGQTPVLQYHFNWKTISVAAGMTFWNFYFRIFDKAVGKEARVRHPQWRSSTPPRLPRYDALKHQNGLVKVLAFRAEFVDHFR